MPSETTQEIDIDLHDDATRKINPADIAIPMWPTPAHKIKKAFKDGSLHATNYYYKEEPDPDWPFNVKTWAVNPYSANRPAAYYSWVAGFCERWAELKRSEQDE